jgi:hypothetical protein
LSTATTKMQLLKADPAELVDVVAHVDNAFDKLDLLLPTQLVTSLTRPGAPFNGQLIKETDTGAILQWDLASATWIALVQANIGAAQGAFKNAIRNGDFSIAQRGAGPFVASGIYTLDGWSQTFINGSMSTTQVAATLGNPAQLDGAKFGLQSVVVGTAAAGDLAVLTHRIESVLKYAGKKVTLTFKAKANAGTPKIGIEVEQFFGTGGAPSATVDTAIQAVTLNVTETEYSITFTVPSIAGKTLGTAGTDYLAIIVWESAGATNNARASGIGVQSFTLTLYDVQIELGASKTVFERLQPQAQLAWCQRYFWRRACTVASEPISTGFWISTSVVVSFLYFPVPMRATPGVPIFSAFATFVNYAPVTGGQVCTVIANGSISASVVQINSTSAAIGVAGQGGGLIGGITTTIDISAEL